MKKVIEWFFGLFGYKKEGQFAKYVWRLFAFSAAVIVALFAILLTCAFFSVIYEKHFEEKYCYDPDCRNSEYLGKNIYYHNTNDGKSYVFNSQTQEKTLKSLSLQNGKRIKKATLRKLLINTSP